MTPAGPEDRHTGGRTDGWTDGWTEETDGLTDGFLPQHTVRWTVSGGGGGELLPVVAEAQPPW